MSNAAQRDEDGTEQEPAGPLLVEPMYGGPDASDGWEQRWWCPVPEKGVQYQVVRAHWSDDDKVRNIYEIKLAETAA